mmetsp:Transcript_5692/g.19359  ORF Transcript_5692/g.19359 Transcript_5692/m.19359 type:complete len:412 (-) Transcript_5692:400-1635(-)
MLPPAQNSRSGPCLAQVIALPRHANLCGAAHECIREYARLAGWRSKEETIPLPSPPGLRDVVRHGGLPRDRRRARQQPAVRRALLGTLCLQEKVGRRLHARHHVPRVEEVDEAEEEGGVLLVQGHAEDVGPAAGAGAHQPRGGAARAEELELHLGHVRRADREVRPAREGAPRGPVDGARPDAEGPRTLAVNHERAHVLHLHGLPGPVREAEERVRGCANGRERKTRGRIAHAGREARRVEHLQARLLDDEPGAGGGVLHEGPQRGGLLRRAPGAAHGADAAARPEAARSAASLRLARARPPGGEGGIPVVRRRELGVELAVDDVFLGRRRSRVPRRGPLQRGPRGERCPAAGHGRMEAKERGRLRLAHAEDPEEAAGGQHARVESVPERVVLAHPPEGCGPAHVHRLHRR